MLNKVELQGHLTSNPKVRYSEGENSLAIARYTLAVNRSFKRQGDTQDADFINCVAFAKLAENAEKYFHKGIMIIITGRIQTGSYTNKDGQKIYTTEVVVEEQFFAGSKNTDSGNSESSRPAPSQAEGDGFMNIPDGIDQELPFN